MTLCPNLLISYFLFSIVCAVSAPCEGTAITGRKNSEYNAFFHLDEGERNVANISLPRVYNVDAYNSSDCAKQKIANRTSSFYCDYNNKQYQNRRRNSCSIMENVSSGEKKEYPHSNVNIAFRKRNLLWFQSNSKYSNEIVTSTMNTDDQCEKNSRNYEESSFLKCQPPNYSKLKNKCKSSCRFKKRKKKPKPKGKCEKNIYDLDCQEKKKLFLLKKQGVKLHKRHLDKVKIDDELDLNKRIEKLVKEIALENQRAATAGIMLTENTDQSGDGGDSGGIASVGEWIPKKVKESFPFINRIKKLFRFSKNYFNNKKLTVDNLNSVPVNIVRDKYPVPGKMAHISSYDVSKTMRKTTRCRRNPNKNYLSYSHGDNPTFRYGGNAIVKRYTYHSHYPKAVIHTRKGKNYLYFQCPRRFMSSRRGKHPKTVCQSRLISQAKSFFHKNIDIRSKRHSERPFSDILSEQSMTNNDETIMDSEAAQNLRSYLKESENTPKITIKNSLLGKLSDDIDLISGTETPNNNSTELFNGFDINYMNKENVFDHTLEKPFLKRDFDDQFSDRKAPSADFKKYEQQYSLQADFPLFKSTPLRAYREHKYGQPDDGYLNPYRYLKIRHALRSYLVHNNILNPTKLNFLSQRKKRYNAAKCCPIPHKCWRSPPLLCIPYIKKGQDDLLRYLIKTIQKMIGKPFPPKIDIFESTKYKPCARKQSEPNCEDVNTDYDDDDDEECEPNPATRPPYAQPPMLKSCSPQMTSTPKPYFPPPYSLPKVCPMGPCPASLAPCPMAERLPPCPSNEVHEYPPPVNPLNSPYPSYSNVDQKLYSTQTCCTFEEQIPAASSPYTPSNSYPQISVSSTEPSVHPPTVLNPPYAPTNYPPPVPLPNAFARSAEPPLPAARPANGPPSTANACSWYMSKSPIERAECFSYTALPYSGPEYATVPSEFQKPLNPQPPPQMTQPNLQRPFNQIRPTYLEPPPPQIQSALNTQPNTERVTIENQYRDKHRINAPGAEIYNPYPSDLGQFRKEENGRRKSEFSEILSKKNIQGRIRPYDQIHRMDQLRGLNEHQMLKSEPEFRYLKNRNKDNTQNLDKYADQQFPSNLPPRPETNNGYYKALNKEENPHATYKIGNSQRVLNDHQMPKADANSGYNKNLNKEDAYKSSEQQCLSSQQQMFKPEESERSFKNSNTQDMYKCGYQQCSLNEQQIPKSEPSDGNDDMFLKTKYQRGIPKNFRIPATEFFQDYDDYYDRYPQDPDIEAEGLVNKLPLSRIWRNFDRKIKKNPKWDSSVRKKRGDNYYAWPDNFDSLNDYEVGANPNDPLSVNQKNYDEAPPDSNWTPPSYELFSELAKAVTESNGSTESVINRNSTFSREKIISNLNDEIKVKSPSLNDYSKVSETFLSNTACDSNSLVECNTKAVPNTTEAVTTANGSAPTVTGANDCDAGNSKGEIVSFKKSEKTGFFQTDSKNINVQSNAGYSTTTKILNMGSEREDKELEANQDLDNNAEEAQIPTTLKTASIVKGPKKFMTKPSPKIYTKVYPDSMTIEEEVNEKTTITTVTTAKAFLEKTTQVLGSSSNLQLQLLAVCEGYLEVVKLIKAQNQTLGEDLDMDLARYCENIISQNFNLQSESSKSKKQDCTPSSLPVTNLTEATEVKENPSKSERGFYSRMTSYTNYIPENEMSEREMRGKVVVDILNSPVYKRQLADSIKRGKVVIKRKKLKFTHYHDINDRENKVSRQMKGLHLKREKQNKWVKMNKEKKKNRKNQHKKNKRKDFYLLNKSDSIFHQRKKKRYRRKEQLEENLLKKGITKEQIELLHLLKKRKRALLSWLYNTKEVPNKPIGTQETEYFEDENDIALGSEEPTYSGTITPKEPEEASKTTESEWSFANESIFPIYAKDYGYDRGGELTEVEVLWRKINEKTHEEKIFRNQSVLALLLTSTSGPNVIRQANRMVGNEFENEVSEIQSKSENKVGFAGSVLNFNKKNLTVAPSATSKNSSSVNSTYTFISKPDPKSIVGAPPNATHIHQNSTRKISHKFGVAKDLFQEYTIEFLNYAVYILPTMFTILFLFCCLCCAMQILKSRKTIKRHKKKKKRQLSTESETTEESERESKKKRREARRKKHAKDNPGYENFEQKRSKTFWKVLKLNSAKPSAEYNDETQTEKKRSFLRFLKGRKDEGKVEEFSSPYSPIHEIDEHNGQQHQTSSDQYLDKRRRKDEKPKTYSQSEAEERRELIALLEELKKIETENTGEKKEVKSVHVQYMTQEDDNPVFQRPEFSFPYQKNVFGMPKGYSFCNKHFPFYQSDSPTVRDYELFDDVNELTELLPCECDYYSKRNDYLRHCDFKINQEGGCKSFIKIFRDAGVTRSKPFREKNLIKNESGNRSFIFNKYRSISTDTSEELMGVTQKNAGTEVRLTDNVFESASPFKVHSKKNADLVEEMDNFKRQLKNKKHVRLKDDGVLCRL